MDCINLLDDELCDSITWLNMKCLGVIVIEQKHFDLTTVVTIHYSSSDCYTFVSRQSGSWRNSAI